MKLFKRFLRRNKAVKKETKDVFSLCMGKDINLSKIAEVSNIMNNSFSIIYSDGEKITIHCPTAEDANDERKRVVYNWLWIKKEEKEEQYEV